jgi:hypothetical protein
VRRAGPVRQPHDGRSAHSSTSSNTSGLEPWPACLGRLGPAIAAPSPGEASADTLWRLIWPRVPHSRAIRHVRAQVLDLRQFWGAQVGADDSRHARPLRNRWSRVSGLYDAGDERERSQPARRVLCFAAASKVRSPPSVTRVDVGHEHFRPAAHPACAAMTLVYRTGDLFSSACPALGHGVNTLACQHTSVSSKRRRGRRAGLTSRRRRLDGPCSSTTASPALRGSL